MARILHPYREESEIIQMLQAATAGERVRHGEIERAVEHGITPEDYDDHALATRLFEHMVVEHDDVDGFMAAMERMRVIRHRIYA